MKEAAVERAATPEELAEMRGIVADAMGAGAIGFATSTAPQHNGADGIPMPSRLADDEELETLITAMGEGGNGVFMLTKGNRTDVPYLEALAAKSGRPFVIAALLHNPTDPNRGHSAGNPRTASNPTGLCQDGPRYIPHGTRRNSVVPGCL